MKLELKHLAPYLPYELKVYNSEIGVRDVVMLDSMNPLFCHIISVGKRNKPILRPLSDSEEYFQELYGMLEHDDVTQYLDEDFLKYHDINSFDELINKEVEHIPYGTLQVFLKQHFDLFGLIPKGLAIDKNTL